MFIFHILFVNCKSPVSVCLSTLMLLILLFAIAEETLIFIKCFACSFEISYAYHLFEYLRGPAVIYIQNTEHNTHSGM